MSLIDRLLSRSPFSNIVEMMKEIILVVDMIPVLFQSVKDSHFEKLRDYSRQISESEGRIDNIKREARVAIPKSLFLPIPKRDLLDLILTLDGIPDRAEDLAKTFNLRNFSYPESLHSKIQPVLTLNKEVNELLTKMFIQELANLIESSFSGPSVQNVIDLAEKISDKTYEAENKIQSAMREVFRCENLLHPSEVLIWIKILEQLEHITHSQEKSSNTLRRILEQ